MRNSKQYITYKKNLNTQQLNGQIGGVWPPPYEQVSMMNGKLTEVKSYANKAAYDLLVRLSKFKSDNRHNSDNTHKIATAESLTAGLIFSTLVDIPFGGSYKYGGFDVYDSDAKRIMLGVKVDNVYSHLCVKEMAIGILRNTNASLAIAVSGNAMATPEHKERIGEVFIGIAGYDTNDKIIVQTNVYNFCEDAKETCGLWYYYNKYKPLRIQELRTATLIEKELPMFPPEELFKFSEKGKSLGITEGDIYAPLQLTETIAAYIRHKTTKQAFEDCNNFINNYNPQVPEFIYNDRLERKWQDGRKIPSDQMETIDQFANKFFDHSVRTNRPTDVRCVPNVNRCDDYARQTHQDKKEFTYDTINP